MSPVETWFDQLRTRNGLSALAADSLDDAPESRVKDALVTLLAHVQVARAWEKREPDASALIMGCLSSARARNTADNDQDLCEAAAEKALRIIEAPCVRNAFVKPKEWPFEDRRSRALYGGARELMWAALSFARGAEGLANASRLSDVMAFLHPPWSEQRKFFKPFTKLLHVCADMFDDAGLHVVSNNATDGWPLVVRGLAPSPSTRLAPPRESAAKYESRLLAAMDGGGWYDLSRLGDPQFGVPMPRSLGASLKHFLETRPDTFDLRFRAGAGWAARARRGVGLNVEKMIESLLDGE